jgi:hypothetical protein
LTVRSALSVGTININNIKFPTAADNLTSVGGFVILCLKCGSNSSKKANFEKNGNKNIAFSTKKF